MPRNQETDPADSLASFSQAQGSWHPRDWARRLQGSLTCPACSVGISTFLGPPQGSQLYLELGACRQLGPGEVLDLPGQEHLAFKCQGPQPVKPQLEAIPATWRVTPGSRQCCRLGGQAQAQVGGRSRALEDRKGQIQEDVNSSSTSKFQSSDAKFQPPRGSKLSF